MEGYGYPLYLYSRTIPPTSDKRLVCLPSSHKSRRPTFLPQQCDLFPHCAGLATCNITSSTNERSRSSAAYNYKPLKRIMRTLALLHSQQSCAHCCSPPSNYLHNLPSLCANRSQPVILCYPFTNVKRVHHRRASSSALRFPQHVRFSRSKEDRAHMPFFSPALHNPQVHIQPAMN